MARPPTMRVARLHEIGEPLKIDTVEVPEPAGEDVLVRVRACGIVPNLANVMRHYPTMAPHLPLPPLPAVFGLDPAGEVAAVGSRVVGIDIGDRVYVNPGRSCGTCRHCTNGEPISCEYYTFNGYFGFSPASLKMFKRYPYGGLGEFMTAPASALVRLPEKVSFNEAARFGYIGTAYSGLRKAKVGPGSVILINGASGTLGVSAVISALAMGAVRILGTGRDLERLAAVKAIAPERIEVFSLNTGRLAEWVRGQTGGRGVDVTIDCLGPGASHETFLDGLSVVRRGGYIVDAGATSGVVGINVGHMMVRNMTLVASLWFTSEEGRQLAALAENGSLDLSVFEHVTFALGNVNQAIAGMEKRHGGFSNFVVNP
jgi:D-arabinose 1-dehydrogenase-like Zn-dependent alcohol dehydrogenase